MALQIRRGTNAERLGFTPVEGEIIYVTDSQLVTVTGTSVDDGTDTITCSVEHGLSANQKIKLISNDGYGLVENTVYYVLESGLTDLSFKVSLTQGGAPVNVYVTVEDPTFAVKPTDSSNVPYGYSIAPVWAGDNLTVGGIPAGSAVLDELNDVTIGVSGLYGVALNNNQHLQFDGVTNQWRNVSNVIVPGSLNVNGTSTLNGNATANGNLTVKGNTILGDSAADFVFFLASHVTCANNLYFDADTLVIDAANGRIGINDTTPSYPLDVNGTIRTTGSLLVDGNTTLGNASGDTITLNAASVSIPNNLNFDSNTFYIDAVNNRVGVNTDSPSVALDVTGAMYVSNNATVNGDLFVNGATTLGNSSGDTTTINGYNLYIPNSLAIDTDLVIIDSTQNRIGFGGAVDATYRVNVNGGVQTSGDVNINGGDLRSDEATFNILPANTTAINIGSTGTTTVNNTLRVGATPKFTVEPTFGNTESLGYIWSKSTTDSVSPTTGALLSSGGAGIAKHLHVGGSLSVDNTDAATNPTTGSIQTDGGLGVVGNTFIGGYFEVQNQAVIQQNLTVGGDLIVNGTTTTINSSTLTVDDKNIELGSVASPTDTTANGGGITLKGTTDKTIIWSSSTNRWGFNVGIDAGYAEFGNISIAPTTNDNRITTTTGNLELGSDSGTIDIRVANLDTTQSTINLVESAIAVYVGGVDTEVIHLGDNAADPKTTIYANGDMEVHDNLMVLGSTQLGNTIELDGTEVWGTFDVYGTTGQPAVLTTTRTGRVGINTNTPGQALDVVGNTAVSGYVIANGDLATNAGVNVNNISRLDSATITTTSTSTVAVDTYSTTSLRTAKYVIQAVAGADVHSVEALVTHNGTTAYITTYGEITSGSSLLALTADIDSGSVRLLVTPASTDSTVIKVARTAINA